MLQAHPALLQQDSLSHCNPPLWYVPEALSRNKLYRELLKRNGYNPGVEDAHLLLDLTHTFNPERACKFLQTHLLLENDPKKVVLNPEYKELINEYPLELLKEYFLFQNPKMADQLKTLLNTAH